MDATVQSAIVVAIGGLASAVLPALILRATAKRDAKQLKRRAQEAQRHRDLANLALQREIERTRLQIEKISLERELQRLQEDGSRPFGPDDTDDDDPPSHVLAPTLF